MDPFRKPASTSLNRLCIQVSSEACLKDVSGWASRDLGDDDVLPTSAAPLSRNSSKHDHSWSKSPLENLVMFVDPSFGITSTDTSQSHTTIGHMDHASAS
ncbi:hypothetical protein PBRA_005510 [Plasmodiophora brassicae]|uniref:Uncharacterized protein n=1 Tax=Plasmodiophora brassicae TaxID=37360 RepID=A0A0G4INL7_PLABS|nr:hypothetical protein PBRA_005510 [Plasmodiophora brassicae]